MCRRVQACADAGDFTSFTALLRGLSPNAIDQELRSMQVRSTLHRGKLHTLRQQMCETKLYLSWPWQFAADALLDTAQKLKGGF